MDVANVTTADLSSMSNLSADFLATDQPDDNENDWSLHAVIILEYIILAVCILGLVLCTSLLGIIFSRFKGRWTKQMILLVNILCCDVLTCIGGISWIVPNNISRPLMESFQVGELSAAGQGELRRCACTARIGLWITHVGTFANLFGLFLMTIDHLIAVKWSLQHAVKLRNKSILISCAIMWLIAGILGFLEVFLMIKPYNKYMDNWTTKKTTHFCYKIIVYDYTAPNGAYLFDLQQGYHKKIAAYTTLVAVSLVFLVMTAVYSYISYVIVSVSRRKKQQNDAYRSTRQTMKGIGTTVLLVSSFLALYLPNAVCVFLNALGYSVSAYTRNIVAALMYLTALIDILIYVGRNKQIRGAVNCKGDNGRQAIQKTKTTARSS